MFFISVLNKRTNKQRYKLEMKVRYRITAAGGGFTAAMYEVVEEVVALLTESFEFVDDESYGLHWRRSEREREGGIGLKTLEEQRPRVYLKTR